MSDLIDNDSCTGGVIALYFLLDFVNFVVMDFFGIYSGFLTVTKVLPKNLRNSFSIFHVEIII